MFARVILLTASLICLIGIDICRAGDKRVWFEEQIQPLLRDRCGKCHGQVGRKGDLELTSMAGVHRGGESGEPLIGPTLQESLLWTAIDSGDMPPAEEPDLTEEEIQRIKTWITDGAPSHEALTTAPPKLNQHAVLPIVLLRCTVCHGPQRQDGKLDLRTVESMLVGGQSGPALVAGDPNASLMIQRIESEACPPRELLLKFFVRRPCSAELQTLREWIAQGAAVEGIRPDVATTEPDLLVADQDRQHWAFQPLPVTEQSTAHAHDLDFFIERKLHEHGLQFSPEADRETLIRRAYIDLIGLPPSFEQWQRWVQSQDDDWYAQMVEQLLASPHYGERWGRYWLDLAGYADSEGGTSADPLRTVAWKYRDYVIAAFNSDKPYDRFLHEQLAGDELIDFQRASSITQEMVDNLIATGFLRMGIDETGSRTMNFVPERLKVISDAITVVSAGLMGLTLECARCHSHKYDPIPHRDYYRFKAIFQGALDEHDWYSYQKRSVSIATDEHRQRLAEVNPALEAQIKQLEARQRELATQVQLDLLRHHYPQQSESDHTATIKALKVADNNRTLPQRILVERLQSVEILDDEQQPQSVIQARGELHELQRQIDQVKRKLVPALAIRALWDQGRPSPTYILRRGEHDNPGELVGPGVPSVLTDGRTPFVVQAPFTALPVSGSSADSNQSVSLPTGRRLAFAKWLTRPDHPLTARVLVNRVWYHHFGTGIVKDLDNFGVMGERPSHPELLDWLAVQFVQHGWSIKHLHRWMMNSRTYKQSSRITPELAARDPDGRLLSRMPLKRLDAEALRDSLLSIADRLDTCGGGLPDTITVDGHGLVSVNPTEGGGWRRSVYLQYRRTEIPTFMDTFDYPQMGPNCIARNVSIVSPQSLFMMNNEHVHELASAFARRVLSAAAHDADPNVERIKWSYRLALARSPQAEELALGVDALREFTTAWGGDEFQALTTYAHTLFNSAAFLYVD